jgi:pyruvate-ferredoxin/flavodoxin oxidoreductase
MIIANATGCSSIWGASSPSIPYTTGQDGRGPAWANSLFEDNAEYGYGIYLAVEQMRKRIADIMKRCISEGGITEDVESVFRQWLDAGNDSKLSEEASKAVLEVLSGISASGVSQGNSVKVQNGSEAAEAPGQEISCLKEIWDLKDYLNKKSVWIIGGDGWAYDIGYGGLDHVLATGDNVNIFVLDTEIYSNTGGQSSKSTQTAAVAKFASSGKRIRKKDLGMMAMSYGYVYVAQISLGADMNQAIKAITEAERYNGPSLIIAYAPCISHGIKSGMGTSIAEEKKAVDAGYWHLYRFNPELREAGKNPFVLDSKEPSESFRDFLMGEVRYTQLANMFPDIADELFSAAEKHANERYDTYRRLARQEY